MTDSTSDIDRVEPVPPVSVSGAVNRHQLFRSCYFDPAGNRLEREDRPEFRTVILPFVARAPGDRIVNARLQARGVDRLLKAEREIRIEFVIQSGDRHLAHQERQNSFGIYVEQVLMHDLILAHIEKQLPPCVVTFRIRVKPARERQSEIDESAKRTGRPFRSNRDIAGRARSPQGYGDRASQLWSA